MSRNRFLVFAIGPNVVSATSSQKAPAALGKALFQVAAFTVSSVHPKVYSYSEAAVQLAAAARSVSPPQNSVYDWLHAEAQD